MSNESKPGAPSTPNVSAEPVSADRRAFMRTVVTGAVAAGVVGTAGKAEAASTCVTPTKLPQGPRSVKLLFNKSKPPTLSQIQNLIAETIGQSGCPYCGLGGVLDKPDIVFDIAIDSAYLADDIPAIAVVQDARGF